MLSPDDALATVIAAAKPIAPRSFATLDALGLVLAEPVCADRDYPPFSRAMMDGYAVRLADAGRQVRVVAELAAGETATADVREGSCMEIMTGASCPLGTEAVVPKEFAHREENHVLLPTSIPRGEHIACPGSECRLGQEVLGRGTVISPLAVATLASFGLQSVSAVPRPSLAVIVTGSEIVSCGTTPGAVQVRDSNGPMLAALAAELGVRVALHLTVPDQMDAITAALTTASSCDLVCITGGVSVGTYDLVPLAIQEHGAEVIFHKIAQKPGKPMLLARINGRLIFGLSGNPLGCHWCFHRYVSAAIAGMQGRPIRTSLLSGKLIEAVRSKPGRARFMPGWAEWQAGHWRLKPLPGVSSADIFTTAAANCYLHVPGDRGTLEAGETVSFSLLSLL